MKIQAALNARQMTQVDLAHRLDVSKSYISQMFGSGARNLTLRTVARIMSALDLIPSISARSVDDEHPGAAVNRASLADFAPWAR